MAKMVNHFRLWVSTFIRRHERERKRERETKSRREFKISPTRVASQCAWQFLPYHRFISTLQDIILSRDKYFKLLVSSSFSSESMEIIRNAQAHVNSSAAFNPTKIRETETERERGARFAKWLHANAWSKFIFVEHVFERKCRVHEFPLGDASSDVIVTCPINSPVGSNHLKHFDRAALLLPGPTFLFTWTWNCIEPRESPSCRLLPRCLDRARVTPPTPSRYRVARHRCPSWESKFRDHVFFLPSFLPMFWLGRTNNSRRFFCTFGEFHTRDTIFIFYVCF